MKKAKEYKLLTNPKVRQIIRDQLAGFKKMNEFVLNERREKLPKMTTEESRQIFEELCEVWEQSQLSSHSEWLEQIKLKELIERRRLFDKIANGLARNAEST